MARVRTHYDNLKVAPDAPLEVIRAAYKTLSQKYHPDRNPGDKDAERIMVLINKAYETLSDPEKRSEHDAWILATVNGTRDEDDSNQVGRSGRKTDTVDSNYPLHWMSYIKKYRINEARLDKVVAMGAVRASVEDGALYLEDKPPYGHIEKLLRHHFAPNWGWYLAALLFVYFLLSH